MDEHPWDDTIPDYAKPDEVIPFVDYARPQHEVVHANNFVASPSLDDEHSSIPTVNRQPQRRVRNRLLYGIGILSAVLVILAATSALFLYAKSLTASNRTPPRSTVSRFRYAACPFKLGKGIIEGQEARCGFLAAPEDRSQPRGSTIQLAVAIFKAPHAHPAPVPVVFLTGGPGGALLDDLGTLITSTNLDNVTLGHDLILLDQRGTGYSRPSLTCPEFTNYLMIAASGNPGPEPVNDLYMRAARACHDRLTKSGVNLQAYTTIADATDVHDLIHALGYRQVNLYGVSYGTRLALTVMRLFPADIRSVVLDSTVPTQINVFHTEPAVTQHAFNTLLQGCAASKICNFAYPHLQSLFYQLVADLNANPVTFQDAQHGRVQLNGYELVSLLYQAMYVTKLIPILPAMIMQISKGDYTLLSRYADYLTAERGISYGMYFSVECGEDMAFTTMQDLDIAANALRPEIKSAILTGLQADFSVCQAWSQGAVPLAQKLPVTSSIPTLILSGEYDPITPPSNGKLAMQTLSNSFFFLFPATGHGVFLTGSCPASITVAFLTNPLEKPGGSCISTMQEPDFQPAIMPPVPT